MKTRAFDTWRDPYKQGHSIIRLKHIVLNEGVTVLVGCNGSGKSTLLDNIREELFNTSTPTLYFDNLHEGKYCGRGNQSQPYSSKQLVNCSEGEAIQLNVAQITSTLKNFLSTGLSSDDLETYSTLSIESPVVETNERFILLDSIDSGYSLDNIIDLKELFDVILKDSQNMDLNTYIIICANSYELAEGQRCLDVTEGRYVTFNDYNQYKDFILKTRQKRDKRVEKIAADKKK